MRIIFGFILAALIPALLMTAWYLYGQFVVFGIGDEYIWIRTSGFLSWCIIVSFGHVLILGVPAYLIVSRFYMVKWWSAIVGGFLLGSIPIAIFTWPLRYPLLKISSSSNGVPIMIDGVPTIAGWLEYISGFSFFGACGAVGAMMFWVVAAPNKSFKRTALRAAA